ncbi:MAG: biopolymer transporter ExbD [Treponema sp.]|jgi:biopolymer transport protein ExbD|nr:biopolymer transporter ExbD [Treponema sp.]
MKFKRQKNVFQDSSASSDVAFLLIIYFIVIAGFNVNKGFLMNLPAKDSSRLILKDDLLRFEMDEDGSVVYEGDVIEIPTAKTLIQAAQENNPDIAVIITIDGQAHWQNVVNFVELAQDMKIDSFSFSMKKDNQDNL